MKRMYEDLGLLSREEETALARRAQAGDERAVEKLVRHNSGFAAVEARRFSDWLPKEDLMQEAMIGLTIAARRYDPDNASGTKFISYAVWWVRKQLLEAVAREGHAVPLSEGANQDAARIARARDALGADARVEEVVEETGLPEGRVRQLWRVSTEPLRIHHAPPGDEGRTTEEIFDPDEEGVELPRRLGADAKADVRAAVRNLPPRLRVVIRHRFGFGGEDPWTYRRIAETVGVSTERVRQLIGEGIALLGETLKDSR